jgi:hypothetical protein
VKSVQQECEFLTLPWTEGSPPKAGLYWVRFWDGRIDIGDIMLDADICKGIRAIELCIMRATWPASSVTHHAPFKFPKGPLI